MEIPKGTEIEATKNMVCKLLKALYGLKQSPRLWYERFLTFLLKKLGLKRIHADHSIFVSDARLKDPVLSVFVDDIKIMAPKNSGIIQRVKAELTAAFSMSDMGPISLYLGLKIDRDRERQTIKLSQPAYIEKSVGEIPPRQGQPRQYSNERIYTTFPTRGRRSLTFGERKISRNDRIHNVLHDRNQTGYCFCHISCKPIRQKLEPSAHRSS